jgi:Rps23 Pro-64 3,4-dihydroxylase Tpa1-like proline 4-hydroxylase
VGQTLSSVRFVHDRGNFLGKDMAGALLAWALSNHSKEIDLSICRSMAIGDFGQLRHGIEERLRALLPELIASLAAGQFELSRIELELVAHGDGAFYNRHIDTFTGEAASDPRHRRVISGVYYFNAQPKSFSGIE